MKRWLLLSLFVFSLVSSSEMNLFARSGDKKGPEHRRHRNPECIGRGEHLGIFFGDPDILKKKLGLSDEQIDKISEINLEYKKRLLKIKEKIAPMRIKLKGMLLEDNVDLDKVRSLLKLISDLQVDLRMLRIKHRLDIEKTLKPSQKKRFRSSKMRFGRGEFYFQSPMHAFQ